MPEPQIVALASGGGDETPIARLTKLLSRAFDRIKALELSRPEQGNAGTNGVDGEPGIDGEDGEDGKDGKDGEPGLPGSAGLDGEVGTNGIDGKDGEPGLPGAAGRGITNLRVEADGVVTVTYSDGVVENAGRVAIEIAAPAADERPMVFERDPATNQIIRARRETKER